jgi:hypothetical protein
MKFKKKNNKQHVKREKLKVNSKFKGDNSRKTGAAVE